jgi:hypothetical protein
MIWFKLVGATEEPVPPNWEIERPDIFSKLHFPRNKPPSKVSNGESIIVYAVGSQVLIATQTVQRSPGRRRSGPPGSRAYRWPWEIDVKTHHFCSPLKDAPKLREVAPDFAKRYAGKFREGSHWEIDEPEYAELAGTIEAAGRPYLP